MQQLPSGVTVEQARMASEPVSAREKKLPAGTGVVPVELTLTRSTKLEAPTERPDAPIVIFTVLFVGSSAVSKTQLLTPAPTRFVQEVNVNVLGIGLAHAESRHASLTNMTEPGSSQAGTGLIPSEGAPLLIDVFVNLMVSLSAVPTEIVVKLGITVIDPLAETAPAFWGTTITSNGSSAAMLNIRLALTRPRIALRMLTSIPHRALHHRIYHDRIYYPNGA